MPETDPEVYEALVYEDCHEDALAKLTELLHYVRKSPIVGLHIGELRTACFEPFGGPDLFNRKAGLLLAEIEAHVSYVKKPIDEEKFDKAYKLSGLKRP